MPRSVHGGRELLNLPGHHGIGCIIAEIEDTSYWPPGKARNGKDLERYSIAPKVTFHITDCDNHISLEFDVDTVNSLENSLFKLDTMTEVLKKFREGLVIEHERYKERAVKVPEKQRYGMDLFE